jgi:hypothetical protein
MWEQKPWRQLADPVPQTPPKVIGATPLRPGKVQVEFGLTGLRRAVVTVPERRFMVGAHHAIAAAVDRQLADLAWQDASIGASLPGD